MNKALDKDNLHIKIADLSLKLDASDTNLNLWCPKTHQKFLQDNCHDGNEVSDQVLLLNLQSKPIPPDFSLADCLCQTEIFEIYQNLSGMMIFIDPKQSPPRAIKVDPDYRIGQVTGNFEVLGGTPFYPLMYIDIILFSNWLANCGELILHACGFAVDGKGYCFTGDSGSGKSTLIDSVAHHKAVTILGEDQVILRKIDEKFWIFGTPWHTSPDRCSPLGVPLESLFFLKKEFRNAVHSVNPFDGITQLMRTAFIPFYRPSVISKIMATLSELSCLVPFNQFSFQLDSDVLRLLP